MLGIVKRFGILFGLLAGFVLSAPAWAHAFPVKSLPQVGATTEHVPQQVRIWFDADLNALFSKMTVENSSGHIVSTNCQVSPSNPRLLVTKLKPLVPGQYWVKWSVVARDGHHTEGKFPFKVS